MSDTSSNPHVPVSDAKSTSNPAAVNTSYGCRASTKNTPRGSLFDIIFPSSSYFSRSALATVFYNFRANHENRAVRGGMERLQGVSCGPAPRPPRRYVGISHHMSSPSAEAGRGAAPHCACTLVQPHPVPAPRQACWSVWRGSGRRPSIRRTTSFRRRLHRRFLALPIGRRRGLWWRCSPADRRGERCADNQQL